MIDASASFDPDEDALVYRYDFGDGSDPVLTVESSVLHAYPAEGAYSVHLVVWDGVAVDTDTRVVDVIPAGTNRKPVPVEDFAQLDPGESVTVDVLANDFDPDGDLLTVTHLTPPLRGTARIESDQTVTYEAEPGAGGSVGFAYVVEDPLGAKAWSSVRVAIAGPTIFSVYPDRDTRITRGHKNRNDGAHTRLTVKRGGKLKAFVSFPLEPLLGGIARATLSLGFAVEPAYGDGTSRYGVKRVHDLSWFEGTRKSDNADCSPSQEGGGPGMTWGCFIDTEINGSNSSADCGGEHAWVGGTEGSFVADHYTSEAVLGRTENWQSQRLEWDVTDDVRSAYETGKPFVQWMIERSNAGKGAAKFGSREWARDCMGDPDWGPMLTVERK